MGDIEHRQLALGDNAARQLANATKTTAQLSTISPRWLVHLLQWVPVEAGIYRLNKVKNPQDVQVACAKRDESELPQTFVDYEEQPREYFLSTVGTVLNVHTRVSDLYSSPHDQIKEQLRLTIETIKEKQEGELINNPDYGLLANVEESQRIFPLSGAPTPDDLDELLTKVWKEPAFFLTHPLAIAAFGRECTRRGVPPPTVSLFGSQFVTWRGIPLIPSDKVPVSDGKSKILLLRVGDKRQGVVGLFQPGLPGEQSPGLSVRFMGIDRSAIASYLISLYCSLAVLTEDALAVLEDVEVGKYHDYADTYSNPLSAGLASHPLSADLADAAALARLANEFFSALPGGAAGTTTSAPGALGPRPAVPGLAAGVPLAAPAAPGSPQESAGLAARAPSLAPAAAAPNGLPDSATTAAPAIDSRAGGPLLGVPEAYAAALPLVGTPTSTAAAASSNAPVPSTPYYFLGEASNYPSALPMQGDFGVPRDDRVTAQSFGLPGAEELRALLSTIDQKPPGPSQTQPTGKDTWFYFVDPAAAGKGGALPEGAHPPFDVNAVRRDFPILSERVNGRQLIWFDNAATTQKPQAVIDRLAYFYAYENSNIHRAAHELAARATDAYEAARHKTARFLGASSDEEIIFVRGATEAINLVAQSWGRANLGPGDEIVLSHLEHHANIVPWQQIASETGAKIRVIPVDDSGQVLLDEYRKLLNEHTKLVAITQVSNALGTVVPVHEIVQAAHAVGARALVDGAQSVSHMRVNMQAMDPDFFVFSGHKIFAPTGIGVVYGKREVLQQMPPYQGGGNMIKDVTFERTLYQDPPLRFEAGTGNIADAVGLGAALDYLERIGLENVARYEHDLLVYATQGLATVPGLRLIGTAKDKASVLSFVLDGWRTEDVGRALNQEGIAVRAGHHCAQPILRRFGLEATVRPSLAFYNTCEEVDCLVAALRRLAHHPRPG